MGGYIGSSVGNVANAAERKQTYSITTATTSLTGLAYTPTKVHVFHNGVRLVDGTDYTATNGTSITLTNAAQNGDEVVVISYPSFQTSDTVSAANGGTFAGNVAMSGTLGVTGVTTLSGNSTVGGTLGVTGKITSTAGITFGSDTSADNVLDDYEEGTWTPAYEFTGGGTVTNGVRGGNYLKVGNLVLIGFNLRSTGVSGVSGSLQISGLPFVVKNATGARMGGSVGFNRDWGADMPNFRIYTVPNTSLLYFYYNAMNTGSSQLGTSQFSTGSDNNVIEASVAYITE